MLKPSKIGLLSVMFGIATHLCIAGDDDGEAQALLMTGNHREPLTLCEQRHNALIFFKNHILEKIPSLTITHELLKPLAAKPHIEGSTTHHFLESVNQELKTIYLSTDGKLLLPLILTHILKEIVFVDPADTRANKFVTSVDRVLDRRHYSTSGILTTSMLVQDLHSVLKQLDAEILKKLEQHLQPFTNMLEGYILHDVNFASADTPEFTRDHLKQLITLHSSTQTIPLAIQLRHNIIIIGTLATLALGVILIAFIPRFNNDENTSTIRRLLEILEYCIVMSSPPGFFTVTETFYEALSPHGLRMLHQRLKEATHDLEQFLKQYEALKRTTSHISNEV